MLTEPANRNIAVRDLRFSARFESFVSGQSWYICRMAVLLLVFGPGRLDLAYSQPPEPSPETVSERTQPRELLQLVQETEDALAAGKWLQAAEQFAGAWELVCRDEDPLLLPDTAEAEQIPAGTSQQTAGGRSQLEALYRRAPPEFRREYQLQFTDLARQRLNEVLPSGDLAALKQIASRFRFLPAATDAARVIARIAIDRGDMLEAALQLELVRRIDTNPTPQLLLQIAVAEWSAGLDTDAVEVLRELTTHHPDARLSSGGAPLQLPTASDDPAAWLARLTGKPAGTVVPAWAQPLGNYRRTGLQGSAAVGIQPIWSENTFSVSDVLFDEKLSPIMDEAGGLLGRISGRSSTEQSTVVPVSQPVVIGDLLIFRTAAGAVRAVSRHTGEMAWETTHYDAKLRSFIPGFPLPAEPKTVPNDAAAPDESPAADDTEESEVPMDDEMQVNPFSAEAVAGELFYQMLRTNPTGQISSDGKSVFVCEESSSVTWNSDGGMLTSGPARLPSNYLRAYDVKTGLFQWEAGGQRSSDTKINPLAGYYFLGAPLILGSRIYVLAESGEGIFLLQIASPETGTRATKGGPGIRNPKVLHSQLLSAPKYKLVDHPVRKHAGLIPSYAQGLLICPTCDEYVIAISAEDHSIRWAYRYNSIIRIPDLGTDQPVLAGTLDAIHSAAVDLDARWTDSLPRIAGQRILITPRDSDALFCLDLQTGRELWHVPRGLSRTVAAVTKDHVVLTGTRSVMALHLNSGQTAWTNEIRDGHVSGMAVSDGNILQIPTSAPAVVCFELSTGRYLLSQQLPADAEPGNLLSVDGTLYSQNLTQVVAFRRSESGAPLTPIDRARQKLLAGQQAEAIEILQAELAAASDSNAARELLVDVLLESLRADFAGSSQHITQIRELITQTSVDPEQLEQLLTTTLGMNLSDATSVPLQLEKLDRSGKRLDQLSELIVRGLNRSPDLSPANLAISIGELLPEISASRTRIVTSGTLSRRNAQALLSGIRRVLDGKPALQRKEIQAALTPQVERLVTASQGDSERQLQLIRDLTAAGLHEAATVLASDLRAAAKGGEVQQLGLSLILEQLSLQAIQQGQPKAGTLLTELWEDWDKAGDRTSVVTMLRDLTTADGNDQNAWMKFRTPESSAASTEIQSVISEWKHRLPDLRHSSADFWKRSPMIEQSPDRTMLEAGTASAEGVKCILPVFGMPGVFRGWSFFEEYQKSTIAAVDASGVRRWEFEPELLIEGQPSVGRITEKYVLTAGHLLALKLNSQLFVLDSSQATIESPPRLLWSININALSRDDSTAGIRQFIPGWERVPGYSHQPAGLFPCGPLTFDAVPVISGRELRVFDPLTGDVLWQLEGLSADAVLLGTETTLLILSESSGQIEVRGLTDGELLSVTGIPEWWIDANENIGASVRDIDMEPGRDILWRISAQGDSCLLFRLSSDAATLELRSLLTDTVTWNVRLPQDSVFSNIAEDMVAVLSNEKELRIFRTDTGTELTSVVVTPVPAPRELYLRPSQNRLIVLPEAVDDPALDLDPVMDGLHVYGRLYALDRNSLQLAWDEPLSHQFIRLPGIATGAMLPNAPILVLLGRGRLNRPGESTIATRYQTRIIDVDSGKELYSGENMGMNLSPHWIDADAAMRRLRLSFASRILTFSYGNQNDSTPGVQQGESAVPPPNAQSKE